MTCPKCGYVMAPFEKSCPRCTHLRVRTGTQQLIPDTRTQYLVQLETCEQCGWMIFPADTVCSSCGAPVHASGQPAARNGHEKMAYRPSQQQILAGVVVGAITICLVSVLIYIFRHV